MVFWLTFLVDVWVRDAAEIGRSVANLGPMQPRRVPFCVLAEQSLHGVTVNGTLDVSRL